MSNSTSQTQRTSAESQNQRDSLDAARHSAAASPSRMRRRPQPENINVQPLGIDNSTRAAIPQGSQWTIQHSYLWYTNACIGAGTLQQDPTMHINSVINPSMDANINYG